MFDDNFTLITKIKCDNSRVLKKILDWLNKRIEILIERKYMKSINYKKG